MYYVPEVGERMTLCGSDMFMVENVFCVCTKETNKLGRSCDWQKRDAVCLLLRFLLWLGNSQKKHPGLAVRTHFILLALQKMPAVFKFKYDVGPDQL